MPEIGTIITHEIDLNADHPYAIALRERSRRYNKLLRRVVPFLSELEEPSVNVIKIAELNIEAFAITLQRHSKKLPSQESFDRVLVDVDHAIDEMEIVVTLECDERSTDD